MKKTTYEPRIVETWRSGALANKVERGLQLLEKCRICPRDCDVNRLEDQYAVCLTGRYALVSSHFPHFGEEDCLRGWRGSGTIFFGHCNLKCVFCQNFDISQRAPRKAKGERPEKLATMMLHLQAVGCHNINFVTPEHVVPQVLEALLIAMDNGLSLPIVYNTSGYDSAASLELLDGVVDIYMPDFKFADELIAKRLVKADDYVATVKHSVLEMQRQVGDLTFDEEGLATRGLLVRHLVMPNDLAGTEEVMRFLVQEVSPNVYVNVMDQYGPAYKAERYPEIDRRTTQNEFEEALEIARRAGVRRIDVRRPHPRLRARMGGWA